MKRRWLLFLTFVLLLGSISTAVAEECDYDPLERNLIFVEGEAEITVPVDGFSLAFSFDVDRAAFGDASKESNKIADKIAAQIKELGLSNVEIIKGWDIVKQAKISIGAKGRRLSNRLVVRVLDYPQGKFHDLIAEAIDRTIAVDSSIALEDVSILISEAKENKKKEEVLVEALKALQSNAKSAAQALGRVLSQPKRIYISSEQGTYKSEESLYQSRGDREYLAKSFASIQKSFRVKSEIVDNVKLTAKVHGIYQLE